MRRDIFKDDVCRWRCSLWRLIWRELILYTGAFMVISLLDRQSLPTCRLESQLKMNSRYCLEKEKQMDFEKLIRWCRQQSTGFNKGSKVPWCLKCSGLPITFLLGFYVSLVVKRWWEQFAKLPWPDTIAIYLKGLLEGAPGVERVRARMIRRTIIRYILLAYILCIRRNSSRLSKRFPNMVTLVKTGIIRKDEAMRIGNEETRSMYGSR